jgi:hypothetical protein
MPTANFEETLVFNIYRFNHKFPNSKAFDSIFVVVGTYKGFFQNQKRKRKNIFNFLFLELGHLYV